MTSSPRSARPFGEQTLRRADEEDRLLDLVVPPHEPDFLAAVLGVMARVGLVRDEMAERRRQHREVGVDRDATVQVAEVVVEARPRLVGDELEVDVFAFGQSEQPVGALAEVVRQRLDRGVELVGRDRLGSRATR